MSKINDGGPAFPHPNAEYAPDHHHHVVNRAFGGMSLRDWFAGQALVGLCQSEMGDEQFTVSPDLLARAAYSMADAMLSARSNREEDNG